jgi:hypothetical protein
MFTKLNIITDILPLTSQVAIMMQREGSINFNDPDDYTRKHWLLNNQMRSMKQSTT